MSCSRCNQYLGNHSEEVWKCSVFGFVKSESKEIRSGNCRFYYSTNKPKEGDFNGKGCNQERGEEKEGKENEVIPSLEPDSSQPDGSGFSTFEKERNAC